MILFYRNIFIWFLRFLSFKHEQLNCLKIQKRILYVKQTLFNSSKPSILYLKRSVVTGVMGSRYERYIFHICTMKIVAKLINFEQIQPSKNKYLKHVL